MSRRFALALDLVDDAELIAQYEAWHEPGRTPPPIIRSILESGIRNMEIYRAGNRMFMLIEADDSYSSESKDRAEGQSGRPGLDCIDEAVSATRPGGGAGRHLD